MDYAKSRLARAFWFTLAALFLVETWLWDHVKEWLRALALALGLKRIDEWFGGLVDKLPPWATLIVFIVPAIAILPLKILALTMIAHGHIVTGLVVIFAAKTLALGVTAFLFDHCRDKLLQMPWFVRFYDLVLRVRAWAHDLVAPVRVRAHELATLIRAQTRAIFGDEKSSFGRKFAHVRALVRRRSGASDKA
jgi:hypothetical protein